jgi:hypothetical protein
VAANYCPRCATPREGGLRYCANCAFDFSAAASATQPMAPPQHAQGLGGGSAPESLARATVRSQAQNLFSRLAALVGLVGGALLWWGLTYDLLADSNPLLWFFGAIIAAAVGAWALGTAVLLWLAPKR